MLPELTWDTLNKEVLSEFPELREPRYSALIGGMEGWEPGAYVIFGSAFNALIEDLAWGAERDRARIGAFIETMAAAEAGGIEELLKIEVLPTFLKAQSFMDSFWPFLGRRTRRLLERVALRKAPNIVFPSRAPGMDEIVT